MKPLLSLSFLFLATLSVQGSDRAFTGSGVYGTEMQQEEQLLDGLLQRGLYETALLYSEERLEKADPKERTHRLAEKVYVLTRKALFLPPRERQEVLAELQRLESESPSAPTGIVSAREKELAEGERLRFSLQLGISEQILGELARMELELVSDASSEGSSDGSAATHPNSLLVRARQRCERLQSEVQAAISGTSSIESLREFRGISDQVEYRNALLWKSIALGFPPDSPDRLSALNRSLSSLEKLAGTRENTRTAQLCRLERIAALRLSGDWPNAGKRFDELLQESETFTQEIRVLATIEGIRLFLVQGQLEQAVQWTREAPPNLHDPEFALARLETLLAIWLKTLDEKSDAKEQLEAALNEAQNIQRDFGSYWERRAQILIAQSVKNRTFENALLYRQLAEDAFHRGHYRDAIHHYDLATDAAENARDAAAAFHFASTAAVLQRQLATKTLIDQSDEKEDEHAESGAMDRCCKAAQKWPEQEVAPELYLTGVDLARSLLARKQISNERYVELLKTYLKTWPDSPKAENVAATLAPMLEALGRYDEVLEVAPKYQGLAKTLVDLRALVESGRRKEALEQYRTLIAKNPNHLTLAENYGDLLADSEEPGELREALTHWRELAKRLKNQGEANKELLEKAEETVILLHIKTGNKEQAKNLIRLHRTLQPDLGSPQRKARFDALERDAN